MSHLDTDENGKISEKEVEAAVQWVCENHGECPTQEEADAAHDIFESIAGKDHEIGRDELTKILRKLEPDVELAQIMHKGIKKDSETKNTKEMEKIAPVGDLMHIVDKTKKAKKHHKKSKGKKSKNKHLAQQIDPAPLTGDF